MTDCERVPVLRVMPGPGDINANGHIFGGWVLSQMDIAAGIVASRRARGPVAHHGVGYAVPPESAAGASLSCAFGRVGRAGAGVEEGAGAGPADARTQKGPSRTVGGMQCGSGIVGASLTKG